VFRATPPSKKTQGQRTEEIQGQREGSLTAPRHRPRGGNAAYLRRPCSVSSTTGQQRAERKSHQPWMGGPPPKGKEMQACREEQYRRPCAVNEPEGCDTVRKKKALHPQAGTVLGLVQPGGGGLKKTKKGTLPPYAPEGSYKFPLSQKGGWEPGIKRRMEVNRGTAALTGPLRRTSALTALRKKGGLRPEGKLPGGRNKGGG